LAAAIGSVVDGGWVGTTGGTAGGSVELSFIVVDLVAFGLRLLHLNFISCC